MMKSMRTTVDLPEGVLRKVKQLALDTDRKFNDVIVDALLRDLNRHQTDGPKPKLSQLPIAQNGGGLLPGVPMESNAEMQDFMDKIALESGGIEKLR
ncbi:MAG: hypothetical protein H7144_09365 [Burkholderiales bacterium]|nr:hypothetical protein [Phycisphaerae bacterium]